MKRGLLMAVASVVAMGLLAGTTFAAERKDLVKVNLDQFVKEAQGSTMSPGVINLVWWIPTEYWKAVFSHYDGDKARRLNEWLGKMEPYMIVVVVRAEVGYMGRFTFYPRDAVLGRMELKRVDGDGKATVLTPVADIPVEIQTVLAMLGPILKGAMGNLGENLHLIVYSDRTAKGERIASPYEKGKIVAKLDKLGKDVGGMVEIDCLLNSLFVPRTCPDCKKEAHISWSFCPWCGKALPK